MSRYSTTRGWGWNHNKKPLNLSASITVCPDCGHINLHGASVVRDERGFVDPFAVNRRPEACSKCGRSLKEE